jgi:hypothetical protein
MKCVYTRLLRDEEMRPHLERGDGIAFEGLGREWQQIERQVERLGFGDTYAVSRTSRAGVPSEQAIVRVSPVHTQQEG